MGRTKYNFDEIKQHYFQSEIKDVRTYFRETYGKYTRHMARKSTGWKDQKKKYMREQVEKAKQSYEKERQNKWKKVLRNVDTARMAGLQELWERLVKEDKVSKLQIREITEALKHMRLELWETTEVTQLQTKNAKDWLEEMKEEKGL